MIQLVLLPHAFDMFAQIVNDYSLTRSIFAPSAVLITLPDVIRLDASPDGTVLASADSKGGLSLWDARSGAPLGALRGHHLRAVALPELARPGVAPTPQIEQVQPMVTGTPAEGVSRLPLSSTARDLIVVPGLPCATQL